jgi:ABC-2 type transport system ATP-binding protein
VSSSPAVIVEGLSKRYGAIEAVDGVSFEVDAGDIFALLGPNGAGKTTTIEILEGFRRRDSGAVSVLGYDPANATTSRQMRERLGVVLQELAIESFLTVRQVLTRHAGYFSRPMAVDDVLEQVGLLEKAKARVKNLSGGQQRRLDLGLGIIGNPELLILDEPTTGFDPSARRDAWDLIRNLADRGTTVVLTTHYMDEAEALASQVAVIRGGHIVAQGSPDSLGGRDKGTCRIRFGLPADTAVTELPVQVSDVTAGTVEIRTDQEVSVLARLTSWALEHNVALTGLIVERLTLEDVYLRLVGYEAGLATENQE